MVKVYNKNSRKLNYGSLNEYSYKKAPQNEDDPINTILILSDNDFTILSLKYLLESKHFYVLTAANSSVGIDLLENIKIDIVLIDYNVSESFCLETLKSIAALFSTIIIIYSGSENIVNEDKFEKAGASCLVNMNDKENLLKSILALL